MKILNGYSSTNFKGYDVLPLKGLYMQGWENYSEQKITKEMLSITQKENIHLFINSCDKIIKDKVQSFHRIGTCLSVWAQDTKEFVFGNNVKKIMCNLREDIIKSENLSELSSYNVVGRKNLPRGGNFYIGYKPDGEKWMLISTKTIMKNLNSIYKDEYEEGTKLKGLYNKEELVTLGEISTIFDVKMKNIHLLNTSYEDLDMLVRPMGYPYVLVNDYKETLKNIEKLQKKFSNSKVVAKLLSGIKKYEWTGDILKKSLEEQGFVPIKIGGAYANNVNFLNALAFRTKNGGISYITNSTKHSSPELEYLEKLFEEDLRSKIHNIENVYFVSGGNAKENGSLTECDKMNEIMQWLREKYGGIHCMIAEIPDFSKVSSSTIK